MNGLQFNQEQYDMLKRCSAKEDMTEWNNWREQHPREDVFLEGANFNSLYLGGVRLDGHPTNLFGKIYLERATFREAILNRAEFSRAHLEKSDFYHANLERALMCFAHLEGAQFSRSDLRGAQLPFCTVNGSTIFLYCRIDQHTWFYGVGLDSARIDPGTKQLLEYNIRRMNWQKWYWGEKRGANRFWLETPREKRLRLIRAIPRLVLTLPVRWFWSLSDYGLSTFRIILWFFGLALVFAGIYGCWAYVSPPGIVSNLMVEPHLPAWHYFALLLLRPFYFSVVTMTTLGFGDMYAEAESIWGHILLTIQVILGYVLLGALVTRFAVLFTAGGPAGKFTDEKD